MMCTCLRGKKFESVENSFFEKLNLYLGCYFICFVKLFFSALVVSYKCSFMKMILNGCYCEEYTGSTKNILRHFVKMEEKIHIKTLDNVLKEEKTADNERNIWQTDAIFLFLFLCYFQPKWLVGKSIRSCFHKPCVQKNYNNNYCCFML